MKKSFIFFLLALLPLMMFSQEEKKPDFRKAFWGINKVEVKKLETGKPDLENNELLSYKDRLFGIDCSVGFIFIKNKLYKGVYLFSEPTNSHSNKTDYLNDYDTIKGKLIEKYGNPKTDETIWKDDLYKDQQSDWGMAISIGHLAKYCEWEKPGSLITLQIFGDNYELSLKLDYEHPEYKKLKEAADKEMEEDKF